MNQSIRKLGNLLPEEVYLKLLYRRRMGYPLDLKDPKTFNEKLQWLKLHDRKPEYITMVDKYLAKQWAAERIGEQHIIPTLGVWEHFDDIDFDSLPERFVLKCTHDSGGLVIVRDKGSFDRQAAREKIERSLRRNYYYSGREWPYKTVPPRVIAEKYMEDSQGKGDLTDYKLHYFSGELKAIMVGQNRFGENGLENDYYTPDWQHYDFTRGHSHNAPVPSPRPPELDKLIELGNKLAGDYPFIRVDLYVIDHEIYFGEMTFYPASGFNAFHPESWDQVFGDFIKLPI